MNDINPRVDLAFKKLFGVEENKDLLISLINSIVSEDDQVADITLLNPYNPKNFKKDKMSVLDIKASGHDGKRFNIEIQIADERDYDKRALYYWSKLYSEQLRSGDDYSELSKAIGIHILNFTSIPKLKKYHNIFHIKERETGYEYFKDLELHTIELNKFSDKVGSELSEIALQVKTSLDRWVAFLTKHNLLVANNLPESLNEEKLKKAINVLEVMNFSEEERDAYEGHLKWLRTQTSALKKIHEDGRAEGRVEGLAEGIAKGEEIGLAKGKNEAKYELAIKLIKSGQSVEFASEMTGLSVKEIEERIKKI